ncbi:MAG TPA: homoserine kinase [bacterium]|nr:homoserine kinase [bacterium]
MAVYTKIPRKDAVAIAKAWRLGAVESFEGIAKGSVNTNYRLVTERGTFFVRLDETRTREQVEHEADLVAFLAGKGFPTPEPLVDARGARVRELLGKPLQVYPWTKGEDYPAEEYDRAHLAEAGRALARLHHAAKEFPATLPNRFGLVATSARWARIRKKAKIPAGDRAEIDAAVAESSREPAPPGPRGIVHGDWFADNLLFEEGRIVGVLDFEAAATDHLTFDVATAVNALCWKPSTPDRFDPRRVDALVDGYAKGKGPAALDSAALSFWLRASALRFTVTRVQDFRLRTSALRVEKDYRDFLRRLRFWSTPARRRAAR